MRQANHIILDFESSKNIQNSQYWVNNFILQSTTQPIFVNRINVHKEITEHQTSFKNIYSSRTTKNLISTNFKTITTERNQLNTVLKLININFLRKEKLYTKLKYSRSPAYDIVSGGAAALLAGFLGFLVSEKFGFELVDSGDFYFLTMYIVFLCFSIRPLLTVIEVNQSLKVIFSLRDAVDFYTNLLVLLVRFFK